MRPQTELAWVQGRASLHTFFRDKVLCTGKAYYNALVISHYLVLRFCFCLCKRHETPNTFRSF